MAFLLCRLVALVAEWRKLKREETGSVYGVFVEATRPLPQDIGTGNSMEETVFWEELPGPVSKSRFRS